MPLNRLDRLTALLEGLAPAVRITADAAADTTATAALSRDEPLRVYLLTEGNRKLHLSRWATPVQGPALVVLQSAEPHRLDPPDATGQKGAICALVRLNGPMAALFLEEFATPRVLSLLQDEPALRLAVELIEMELEAPRCGQPVLLHRAGDILFIGMLRHLVAHPGAGTTGLFNGLADPRMARALVAMHLRPQADWTLERLAEEAGMSRTAFASHFREVMQRTPGRYLSAIRLARARGTVEAGKGLKEAARVAGYGSVSALSRALSHARRQEGMAR